MDNHWATLVSTTSKIFAINGNSPQRWAAVGVVGTLGAADVDEALGPIAKIGPTPSSATAWLLSLVLRSNQGTLIGANCFIRALASGQVSPLALRAKISAIRNDSAAYKLPASSPTTSGCAAKPIENATKLSLRALIHCCKCSAKALARSASSRWAMGCPNQAKIPPLGKVTIWPSKASTRSAAKTLSSPKKWLRSRIFLDLSVTESSIMTDTAQTRRQT